MNHSDTIDLVKGYWNKRPCNIRHSQKPIGSKEYFDEVEARKYFVEPHIPNFAQFSRWKEKKVLEIGCGIGTDSINFARVGAKLTVVDLSQTSLDLCRSRFQIYGLQAHFYCGSAEQLSSFLPIETYDLIYSFGVIHHTPSPEKVFQELKKYVTPHSELRIMLYSKWCWKVFWIVARYGRMAFWRAKELVRRYSEAQEGCPVTHVYSFQDIGNLLKSFEIMDLSKDHIFSYQIDKYVNYQYEQVWYFRRLPAVFFRWLERHFGWHTLIVARLKNSHSST